MLQFLVMSKLGEVVGIFLILQRESIYLLECVGLEQYVQDQEVFLFLKQGDVLGEVRYFLFFFLTVTEFVFILLELVLGIFGRQVVVGLVLGWICLYFWIGSMWLVDLGGLQQEVQNLQCFVLETLIWCSNCYDLSNVKYFYLFFVEFVVPFFSC